MKTLFVIDSYLSTEERANACKNLIYQIRQVYPEKQILLINKFTNSWEIEKLVDFYYYNKGFLLSEPPQEILSSGDYTHPYLYTEVSTGTLENWLPLTGTSDHAADVFNSFVIASNIAKLHGYTNVFKIEYDTEFDIAEFESMRNDIENFEDYLIYGKRHEGFWANTEHSLIDVHAIGFSTKLFESQSILKNDNDYWKLCEQIGYYGKWVEYVICAYIDYKKKIDNSISGITYENIAQSDMFPNTKFDTVSSVGFFTTAWDVMPKISNTIIKYEDKEFEPNKLVIFYQTRRKLPDNVEKFIMKCKISKLSDGELIYEKENSLPLNWWIYDIVFVYEPVKIVIENIVGNDIKTYEQILNPEDIENLTCRFVFNN